MDKLKTGKEPESGFASFRRELAKRIRQTENEFANREEAAAAAGVAKSTFQRWAEGKSDPSFEGLAKLAAATGHSLDWIAFGREPAAAAGEPLDEDLMMECIIGADTLAPADMAPAEKARRTLAVYREAKAKGLKISNIIEILKAS